MFRILIVSVTVLYQLQAQPTAFPLESVTVEGTALSKEVVIDIAGLHIGAPVDKAAMDAAAQKLGESGLFETVNYRYGPGPKRGYVLIFQVTDPRSVSGATIDVPGVNEDETWQWVAARYPSLNRKVPNNEAAQSFLAAKIEEHLGASLEGHHLAGKTEVDFMHGGKSSISFQPDPLPRVAAMNFTGQRELTAEQLAGFIPKDVREDGYTDRRFRQAVELNLRREYEDHGMYHVRFPSIVAQRAARWSVSVTTSIEEGPKFKLGEVQVAGEKLPVDAMLKAAKFRKEEVANWSQIQRSIFDMEYPVKRLGYLNVATKPERVFHDDEHVVDLRLQVASGSLFRFGQLKITGLPPNLEAQARKMWGLNAGDPFDYDYPRDFFQAFFRVVDSRQFKKFNVKMAKGAGENVMDFELVFER